MDRDARWRPSLRQTIRAERAAGVRPAHVMLQLVGMAIDLGSGRTYREDLDYADHPTALWIDHYASQLVSRVVQSASRDLYEAMVRDPDLSPDDPLWDDVDHSFAFTNYATLRMHVATLARRYPDAIRLSDLADTDLAWIVRATSDSLEALLVVREIARTLLSMLYAPGHFARQWSADADYWRATYHADYRDAIYRALRDRDAPGSRPGRAE